MFNASNQLLNSSIVLHENSTMVSAFWREYKERFTVIVSVMMAMCGFGTVLNLLLAVIILRSRELRSGSGILIANTMFAELSLCAVHYPLYLISTLSIPTSGPLSVTFCRYTTLLYFMAIQTSFYGLLATAVNRLVAVVFPHHYRKITSRKALAVTIALTYLIPLACDLPLFFNWGGSYVPNPPWGSCGLKLVSGELDYVQPTLVFFNSQFPMAALGCIYAVIFAKVGLLRRHKTAAIAPVLDDQGKRKMALQERRIQVGKMLFYSYLWYLFCFIPPSVLGGAFTYLYRTYPLLLVWGRFLQLLVYSTNPIIFLVMNTDYQRGIKFMLCKKLVRTGNGKKTSSIAVQNANTYIYNNRSLLATTPAGAPARVEMSSFVGSNRSKT